MKFLSVYKKRKWQNLSIIVGLVVSLAGFTVGCSKKDDSGNVIRSGNGSSCTSSGCLPLNTKGLFADATGKVAIGWNDIGTMSVGLIAQNGSYENMGTQEIADHHIGVVPNNIGTFGVRGYLSINYVTPETCLLPQGEYDLETIQAGQWSGKHGDNTIVMEARGRSSNNTARIRMSMNILGPGSYSGIDSNGNVKLDYEYRINAAPFLVETVNGQVCNPGLVIVTY